jgi:hypothetical protein
MLEPNCGLESLDYDLVSSGPLGVAIFASRVHIANDPCHLPVTLHLLELIVKVLELAPRVCELAQEPNISIVARICIQENHVQLILEQWQGDLGWSLPISLREVNEV